MERHAVEERLVPVTPGEREPRRAHRNGGEAEPGVRRDEEAGRLDRCELIENRSVKGVDDMAAQGEEAVDVTSRNPADRPPSLPSEAPDERELRVRESPLELVEHEHPRRGRRIEVGLPAPCRHHRDRSPPGELAARTDALGLRQYEPEILVRPVRGRRLPCDTD